MRRFVALLVLALALLGALVAFAVGRRSAASAADCEKKPPPSAFALASCDDAGQPQRRPATPAPRSPR
jgi:hypothetical protein